MQMARNSSNNRKSNRKSTSSGSFVGVMDLARERPVAAAATAAGAVAAGVFLWSKRAQISDQLSQLSDQIGEWTDQMGADRDSPELETASGDTTSTRTSSSTRRNRTSGSGRRSASNGDATSVTNEEAPVA
jgi:hypothetical protein